MEIKHVFIYLIFVFFAVIFFPVMYRAVLDTNMTGWSFPGASGIAAILRAFPIIFIVLIVLVPAYYIMRRKS